ncbi:MAG: DnaJ domain-containing protein [Desulfobacteraceae bacterium]|nr:DnaJ domain-containing protein [Desulfobacteraceae bacterium]
MRNYYKVLGVSETADEQEIRSAYLKLAEMYDPDKNPNYTLGPEMFKMIREAYKVLSDPVKRIAHDELLKPESSEEIDMKNEYYERELEKIYEKELEENKYKYYAVSLFALIIGFIIMFSGIRTVSMAYGSDDWPAVEGIITGLKIKKRGSGRYRDLKYPSAQITTPSYKYKVNEKQYTGNRLSFGKNRNVGYAEKIARKYKKGEKTDVFYNPGNPEISVLIPGIPALEIHKIILGISFIFTGVLAVSLTVFPAGWLYSAGLTLRISMIVLCCYSLYTLWMKMSVGFGDLLVIFIFMLFAFIFTVSETVRFVYFPSGKWEYLFPDD